MPKKAIVNVKQKNKGMFTVTITIDIIIAKELAFQARYHQGNGIISIITKKRRE